MSDANQPQFQRLFVALSVPDSVKFEMVDTQKILQTALPQGAVRWTKPEHFHLTLRFLGNVAIAQTEALSDKLRFACHPFPPLHVRAERLGFFPERGFPRVIWASLRDAPQQLTQLHRAVQTSTLEFTTEPFENEFAGHITLGRARKIRRSEADTLTTFAAKMRDRVFGEWTVSAIELMKSELLPDGAHHTVLAAIPLAGKAGE